MEMWLVNRLHQNLCLKLTKTLCDWLSSIWEDSVWSKHTKTKTKQILCHKAADSDKKKNQVIPLGILGIEFNLYECVQNYLIFKI